MTLKKIIFIVLGCIGVGLGAVGAVVPLLPFRFCCWRRSALPKALKNCISGLWAPNFIRIILKAMCKDEE